jgi:hypothetical protein
VKAAWLVVRLIDPNGVTAGEARFELEGNTAANVNSQCLYRVECFIERRDYVAAADAPFWDVR